MSAPDQLATAAVSEVEDQMVVGLGTGRAASRAIRALAQRVREEELRVRCAPTSAASEALARELGLEVVPASETGSIDLLFDGVDELDPDLAMLKGRGGAMTREKILAHAADRRIYLLQRSKLVTRLGETGPVPVEALEPYGSVVEGLLRDSGIAGVWRKAATGEAFRTDNGNRVLDITFPQDAELAEFVRLIEATPGVVGHGIFAFEADRVLIEDEDGTLEIRDRAL